MTTKHTSNQLRYIIKATVNCNKTENQTVSKKQKWNSFSQTGHNKF